MPSGRSLEFEAILSTFFWGVVLTQGSRENSDISGNLNVIDFIVIILASLVRKHPILMSNVDIKRSSTM